MIRPELKPPDWVNWLAQDADGAWWGYSVEPLLHDTGWYENEVGDSVKLEQGCTNSLWKKSLTRTT